MTESFQAIVEEPLLIKRAVAVAAVLFCTLQNRADGVFFGCLYYATM